MCVLHHIMDSQRKFETKQIAEFVSNDSVGQQGNNWFSFVTDHGIQKWLSRLKEDKCDVKDIFQHEPDLMSVYPLGLLENQAVKEEYRRTTKQCNNLQKVKEFREGLSTKIQNNLQKFRDRIRERTGEKNLNESSDSEDDALLYKYNCSSHLCYIKKQYAEAEAYDWEVELEKLMPQLPNSKLLFLTEDDLTREFS